MQNYNPQQAGSLISTHLQQQQQQHTNTETNTEQDQNQGKLTANNSIAAGKKAFVKPFINQQDFAQTLTNYRVFVHDYNKSLYQANKDIREYNKNLEHKEPTDLIAKEISHFHDVYRSEYNNHIYNQAVEKFNQEHGLYIKKRKIQSVKPATVEFFAAFLHEYMVQLHKRNKIRSHAGIEHKQSLPDFKLNPNNIIQQMRNGIQNLDVSTRSIRRHRQRLEECGVLVDYSFHSHARPIEIGFNTSILCVRETKKTPNHQNTKNQSLNSHKRTKCPHTNVVVTSTFINNKKKKEIVDNQSQVKEVNSGAIAPNKNNYKNTSSQVAEKEKASQAEKSKKEAQYSENLRDRLEMPFDLAAKLANGEFDYYNPIDIRRLLYEVRTGTLSAEEFKEFCIQDFLKQSASLWKNNHAAAGSWYNTHKMMMQDWFMTFTGLTFDKLTTLKKLRELRYRLKRAKSFFENTKWQNVRYPSVYFNLKIMDPKNVCFGYTLKFWKQKQTKDTQYQKEQAQRNAKAQRLDNQKKEERKNSRKLNSAVGKFLKKQMTFDDLTNYVSNNLPTGYIYKIPNIIQAKTKTYA
jgi:hypothetical protein